MRLRQAKTRALMLSLVLIAGILWKLLPGALEPFHYGMRYTGQIIVSGNVTDWQMEEVYAGIYLHYRDGDHLYTVSSFNCGGKERHVPDLPALTVGEEKSCHDLDGNFWYICLPHSEGRSAFGRLFRMLCAILVAVAAPAVSVIYHKHRGDYDE